MLRQTDKIFDVVDVASAPGNQHMLVELIFNDTIRTVIIGFLERTSNNGWYKVLGFSNNIGIEKIFRLGDLLDANHIFKKRHY